MCADKITDLDKTLSEYAEKRHKKEVGSIKK
jgi:hypothetical protein